MFGEAGLISCPIMWFAVSSPLLPLVFLRRCARLMRAEGRAAAVAAAFLSVYTAAKWNDGWRRMLTISPSFPDPAFFYWIQIQWLSLRRTVEKISLDSYIQAHNYIHEYIQMRKHRIEEGGCVCFQDNHCASLIAGQAIKEGQGPPW